jgi:coenzyme F420 hydrogenase subunit beta
VNCLDKKIMHIEKGAYPEIRKVIKGGFCIGCGACATVSDGISLRENKYGDLVAMIESCDSNSISDATGVCPFSTHTSETEIMSEVFDKSSCSDPIVGRYESVYAGYSNLYRKHGSSGGIATHFLAALLEQGVVDQVVCVGPSQDRLVDYAFVSDSARLIEHATSFYYPVTMEEVIRKIRSEPGRYAITGVPCFHKALRLLKKHDPVLNERIVVQVGLVCGQMKSAHYSEYLARRAGKIGGEKLIEACFRSKVGSTRADDYFFVGRWQDERGGNQKGSISARNLGVNWAMSYFKPKACDYCDDVLAECADISVMDAWVKELVEDPQGTSLVIARSKKARDLLVAESERGKVSLWDTTVNDLIQSQMSGLRHRRQGLRFRLQLMKTFGFWVPRKRVKPSLNVGFFVAAEMVMRGILRRMSRLAFRLQLRLGNDLRIFNGLMAIPLLAYKIFGKLRRIFEKPKDHEVEVKSYRV